MLTPAAEQSFKKFEARVEPQLSEFGNLGAITDWGGKIVGTVGRIAGNLHAASLAAETKPWEYAISIETIDRAIQNWRLLNISREGSIHRNGNRS